MKVKLDGAGGAIGGMSQVYAGLHEYLPKAGIEIVKDIKKADVVNAHIGIYEEIPVDKPLVVSSHGMLWDSDAWGGGAWKINQVCIDAYRQADVITTPSDFVAHAIRRNMLRDPLVVRHGINPEQWLPGENGGYVLWNKARKDAASNPRVMNQLAAMAPAVDFISTFGEASSNVTVVGKQSIQEMLQLVSNAGVYLITPKESGGPCFGVLEAMSCGVPVLSWNWGGTAEAVIHKETGYLAKPGNYEDLLEGLHYCFLHRERMGLAARQYVIDHHRWEHIIHNYIQAYELALKKKPNDIISVVVPCYNLGKYLPACVQSVKDQTYENWELIIVDDCSTDDSFEIAQELADDDRIKIIRNEKNEHVATTRNIGINAARGSYILPLDADDRLAPKALLALKKVLDSSRKYDIVSGKLILFGEDNLEQGRKGEWPNNAEYIKQISGYNRLPYSSMYRRRIWENIGGYRSRIREGVEDADFWTRALSYGYQAEIIDIPTLYYTLRENGLGKKNVHGVDAWLGWFGWHYLPENTPFGADLGKDVPIRSYDNPQVSVVIPVGPHHERHLQTCLDSLLSQTNQNWQAVVVNDTGRKLTVAGMPFVTVVNMPNNSGVAAARNAGIVASKSDKIIFLDVDDVAQPHMIDSFLVAHAKVGGWVYSDWYANNGTKITHSTAKDWNLQDFVTKMLGPITGLYEKQHLFEIGGFDEKAPGWEDWDMQLSLVEKGICGTRVVQPLLVYNLHYGSRREENFSSADSLLQYIQEKHKTLYNKRGNMGCSRCGGKSSVQITTKSNPIGIDKEKVLLKYTGPISGKRHFRSPNHQGTRYAVTNKSPFTVYADDADHFLRIKDFERVDTTALPAVEDVPILESQLPMVDIVRDIMELNLRPEIYAVLDETYNTVDKLKSASDTELLSVKGIGPARLKEIREALNA